MQRIIIFIAVIFFFSAKQLYSQNERIADSLKKELNKITPDSARFDEYGKACFKFLRSNRMICESLQKEGYGYAIKTGDEFNRLRFTMFSGVIASFYSEYNRADSIYKNVIEQAKKLTRGKEKLLAKVYKNYALNFMNQGLIAKSIEYNLEALKMTEEMKDTLGMAGACADIGNSYIRIKRNSEAKEYLNKALQYFTSLDFKTGIGNVLNSLGVMADDAGQKDSALAYYQRAYQIRKETGDKVGEVKALTNIAQLLQDFERYDEEIKISQEALAIADEIGLVSEKAILMDNLANMYRSGKKDYAKALNYSLQAYNIAVQVGDNLMMRNFAESLSLNYEKLNNLPKAIEYRKIFESYSDSVLNEKSSEQIADMQTKYETEKKEVENKLLNEQNKVNHITIKKQNHEKIFLLSLIGLLIVAGWFAYSRYKLKQQEALNKEIIKQKEIRSKAVIEAEEKERQRIGKDLHDGVGQLLSAAKMNLSKLQSTIPLQNVEQKTNFSNAIDMLDESVKEVRTISHNMMPNMLIKSGLAKAVREFIDKIASGGKLKMELQITGMDHRLDSNTENILFRVLQEIVNNIIKHSQATEVSIQLIRHDSEINMMVEDNGVGFDAKKIEEFDGIGLKNIQSRIEFLNGKVDFDSQPGRGTIVNIEVPVV